MREGTWLTDERLRVYPRMIFVFLMLAILGVIVTSHAGRDFAGRPLGVDFSGQWVAGTEVLSGHPAMPYDNVAHAARQQTAFGPSGSYLPWNYPPLTLGLAAGFACLPYLAALGVWMVTTFLFYLAAIRRAARGLDVSLSSLLTAASAFPAVAINILHGQNGLMSAGLMTFGAFSLERRPVLGGILLGLLAYKPQFLFAVPFVLLAGGFGRATLAFGATLVLTVLASILAFGMAPWHGFLDGLAFSRTVILEGGGLESYKLQSAFAAARLLGSSVGTAYVVQAFMTICALVGLTAVWRSGSQISVKVAALLVASLIVTPYAVDYDMVLLGPALAALVTDRMGSGFRPYQKSLFALVWLLPLVARLGAFCLHVPLGLIGMALLFAELVWRSVLSVQFLDLCEPRTVNPAATISKSL